MALQYEKLSPAIENKLITYISPLIQSSSISTHRARLEKIDRLIQRSYDTQKSQKDRDDCRDFKAEPEEDNVTIPVVGPQLSTISAQLSKIFLRTDPPIQMFASPQGSPIANRYNIIYGKYSRDFQWRKNLLKTLQDAVKYNFTAAEVQWKEVGAKERTTEIDPESGASKVISSSTAGEAIQHLHPYNVFWDTSVPLDQVPRSGAFAGYIKQFTKIALYQFLYDQGISLTPDQKKKLSSEGSGSLVSYYIPKINDVETPDNSKANFDSLFDPDEKESFTSTETYTYYSIYLRIIPADVGIFSENSTEVNILHIQMVGDSLIVGARLLDNSHNLIPIIFGQIEDTALGLNSFTIAEELAPIQNTATKLYRGEIASIRRLLADRAIYDPHLLNPDDVNDPSPTAKIKLRRSLSGSASLANTYFPIPYEDRALGIRISQANELLGFASPIAGTNKAMEGQFIKGNKSAQEFNTIMASAGDRVFQSAVFFDDQFMAPLRTILMSDTLQYQNDITIYDRQSGEFIEINMEDLRDAPLDFEVAAGLVPADQMASADFLQVLIQTFMSSQMIAGDFKAVDALCYLAEMQGVKYLSRFIKSDAEKQAEMEQAMAMQQAMAQAQTQEQGPEG